MCQHEDVCLYIKNHFNLHLTPSTATDGMKQLMEISRIYNIFSWLSIG